MKKLLSFTERYLVPAGTVWALLSAIPAAINLALFLTWLRLLVVYGPLALMLALAIRLARWAVEADLGSGDSKAIKAKMDEIAATLAERTTLSTWASAVTDAVLALVLAATGHIFTAICYAGACGIGFGLILRLRREHNKSADDALGEIIRDMLGGSEE